MSRVARVSEKRDLGARRSITIDLPEFIVQTLEFRVTEANAGSLKPDERVTIDHLVEVELAETVSIAELALLEPRMPGITAAAWKWIGEAGE